MICEMCADTAEDQCVHCLRAERDRLREHVKAALDLNRQMYRADEDNDSPGNMQHAILVAALQEEQP